MFVIQPEIFSLLLSCYLSTNVEYDEALKAATQICKQNNKLSAKVVSIDKKDCAKNKELIDLIIICRRG